MSSINLICTECLLEFNLSKKEYNRQTKKGRDKFFCSLSCAAKYSNKNNEKLIKHRHSEKNISNLLTQSKIPSKKRKNKFKFFLKKQHIGNIKQTLKNKDLLTEEILEKIWNKQRGLCAISNLPMEPKYFGSQSTLYSASLDRIDSKKGYTEDNIQFTCYGINLAKNKFSQEKIINFIKSIKNF